MSDLSWSAAVETTDADFSWQSPSHLPRRVETGWAAKAPGRLEVCVGQRPSARTRTVGCAGQGLMILQTPPGSL